MALGQSKNMNKEEQSRAEYNNIEALSTRIVQLIIKGN